jgi:hypothetical protein
LHVEALHFETRAEQLLHVVKLVPCALRRC